LIAVVLYSAAIGVERVVPVELSGVPNLHRVTESLYRSAQPTRIGFRNLEAMGIRTVINLRSFHGDDVSGTGLRLINVPMQAWDPEMDEVLRVMRILADRDGGPYLVHCQHGADRTGMVTALYRMVFQGWNRDDAINEMTDGGFGYHAVWTDIPKFLRRVDIERIKRRIGR
jgi:protein tyrosine/serine phosphatase